MAVYWLPPLLLVLGNSLQTGTWELESNYMINILRNS